jgi:plasmid stabilization system protein ParE
VKVSYRQAALDDLVQQFRYYLTVIDLPEIAIRFRDAVRQTLQSLRQHPLVGPRCFSGNPRLQNLALGRLLDLKRSEFIIWRTKRFSK